MKGIIYKHTLEADCPYKGGSYIGKTFYENPEDRGGKDGRGYKKSHTVFCKAIEKYGGDNFTHEIIEDNILDAKLANERERYWIAFFHTFYLDENCAGYNMTLGGEGQSGPHTEEYNKTLSAKMGGRPIICIETQQIYYGFCAVKRLTGIRHVNEVCQGLREIAGGFHGAYLDDLCRQAELAEFVNKPRNITKKAKRKIQCVETGEIFESITCAKTIHSGCISKALSGERELAAGFHWRYIDD